MILLVNTEVANIGSWKRILNENNYQYILSDDLNLSHDIKKIIFPGVGNFGKVIDNIKKKNLDKTIINLIKNKNVHYLGVCIGMQILFDYSEESESPGLGLINGKVKRLNFSNLPQTHNGWNSIKPLKKTNLLKDINFNYDYYFNHTYYCEVKYQDDISATLKDNDEINTVVEKNNIYGVQFHPEKSHSAGKEIIKNFLKI